MNALPETGPSGIGKWQRVIRWDKVFPLYIPFDEYDHSSPGRRSYREHHVKWPSGVPWPYPGALETGEQRGEVTTRGPWGIISGYRALAISEPHERGILVHGERQLINPRQCGYEMEGTVSVGGKRRRAFTSSRMFDVDGTLVDVAILFVCGSAQS